MIKNPFVEFSTYIIRDGGGFVKGLRKTFFGKAVFSCFLVVIFLKRRRQARKKADGKFSFLSEKAENFRIFVYFAKGLFSRRSAKVFHKQKSQLVSFTVEKSVESVQNLAGQGFFGGGFPPVAVEKLILVWG